MLFVVFLLFVQIVSANVNIDAPLLYDDGSELLASDIDHYEICVSNNVIDVCDEIIDVVGDTIAMTQIPHAKFLKAKTVDIFGRRSAGWSNTFNIRSPLPPNLSIKIIINVGQ
tara:strand:- start:306 stop:644 length:339 start_codon:yes stop_codon:yes gene_type:complete